MFEARVLLRRLRRGALLAIAIGSVGACTGSSEVPAVDATDAGATPDSVVVDIGGSDTRTDSGTAQDTGDAGPQADATAPPADAVEDAVVPDTTSLPDSHDTSVPDTSSPGPDAPTDAEGPDSGDTGGGCSEPPTLSPFDLYLPAWLGRQGGAPVVITADDAEVLAKGKVLDANGNPTKKSQITFHLPSQGDDVGLIYELPLGLDIPVTVGQEVRLYIKLDAPWWFDVVFVVWDKAGHPIFFAHHATAGFPYDCGGLVPCPSVEAIPSDCPAAPMDCGTGTWPSVQMQMQGAVSSSEVPQVLQQGEHTVGEDGTRYVVARSYAIEKYDCVDYPGTWLSALMISADFGSASQCACESAADCAPGEVCEPDAHRCVPDRCTTAALSEPGKGCFGGSLCNPFTGECTSASSATSCGADSDCSGVNICNPATRLCSSATDCTEPSPACVPDLCAVMDCVASCSSLLGACYECLASCDCTVGTCDLSSHACTGCDTSKLGLTQDNPEAYEFFELCIPKGGGQDALTAELQAIEPSITCGVAGFFAKCDKGSEVGCHGDLQYEGASKVISDEGWATLCELSAVPNVTKIAGGHYVQ